MNVNKFSDKPFNINNKFCFYCSGFERENIIKKLVKFYRERKYNIYNHNLIKIGKIYNTIEINVNFKENNVLFVKIVKPIDYILLNNILKKNINLFSFICGSGIHNNIDEYNYLIFQKNNILNKRRVIKIFSSNSEFYYSKYLFDKWWDEIDSDWLIIRISDFKYTHSNDLMKYFEGNKNKKENENSLSYLDFLYDYF